MSSPHCSKKHATLIKGVFSELSGSELQQFETMLKRIGVRAQNLEAAAHMGLWEMHSRREAEVERIAFEIVRWASDLFSETLFWGS